MSGVDTRDTPRLPPEEGYEEHYKEPGLGRWMSRNRWLLMRLFMVMLFTFSASLVADQFAYMLEGKPTRLSVEQINAGRLPPGVGIGDYVRITGTPDVGENLKLQNMGEPASKVGISSRYSVSYFYFRLEETKDDFLVQTAQELPGSSLKDFGSSERVWDGRFNTVGGAIFHDTTQQGLGLANLPRNEAIPIIETGDTPGEYRELLPSYLAVLGVWLLSLAWIAWKRNKPFLGV